MKINSQLTNRAAALVACMAIITQSQTNSAIEFYDPAGKTATSKFGWMGDVTDGYFFIETPEDGDGFKLQKGSLTLSGIISATKFVGNGGGLTGLNLPAEIDPTVPAELKDGISWSEIQDIPVGFADGVDNVATFEEGRAGEDPSAQEVAAVLLNNATFLAEVKGKDGTTPDMTDYALKTDLPEIPDLTVLKNGISWSEIQDIPADFADGVDNLAADASGNTVETASPQEVAAVLLNDDTFLAKVKGDKGDQGAKGEQGTPGLTGKDGASPSVDDIAAALKLDAAFRAQVKGEQGAKGEPGVPGLTGKDGASPSIDDVAAELKQDAAFRAQVKGDKGEKGEPGSSGPTGKDGISPSVNDVAAELKQDATFRAQVKGERGEPGEKGDPGSNRWEDIIGKPNMDKYARLEGANFEGGLMIGGGINVSQTSGIDADLSVSGQLEVGDGCTGCTTAPSDRRFKKNIEKIESPLQKIKEIDGVGFNWRKDEFPEKHFSEERELGVIAQDVKEVMPEAVSQDKDGYYLVDYPKLVPLLIEAVKEQQTTIQILKGKLAEQTKNFNDRLSAIENRL